MGELPLVHKVHHRLLRRHADDDDRLAARPDVLATSAGSRACSIPPATSSSPSSRSASASASTGRCWRAAREASRSAECAVGQVQSSLHARHDPPRAAAGDARQPDRGLDRRRPRSSATPAPPARTRSPATARAARCATMTPRRFKFASDFVKGRVGTVKSRHRRPRRRPRQDRQGRQVDRRRQVRHPQRVHAQPRPQARHDGDRLQRLPHRSAAEADPHRSRRARRQGRRSPTPRAAPTPAPTASSPPRSRASCAPSTSCRRSRSRRSPRSRARKP